MEPIPVTSARRRAAEPEDHTVVHATDRFRALMRGRPWRRHRRRITLGVLGAAVGVAALLAAAVFLPPLQVREVEVTGLGYVDEDSVREAAADDLGGSVLLLPSGRIASAIEQVPGVASARVARDWPDGARITITESLPLAEVSGSGDETQIVDADGVVLPDAAAEDASLVPLTVGTGSTDEQACVAAMLKVLDALPSELRESLTSVTATTPSDVTLVADTEEGEKTIVWGDAHDSELKADVTQALLAEPGDEIDVSSPIAPVTR